MTEWRAKRRKKMNKTMDGNVNFRPIYSQRELTHFTRHEHKEDQTQESTDRLADDMSQIISKDIFEYSGTVLSWKLLDGQWYSAEQVRQIFSIRQVRAGTQSYLITATESAVLTLECIDALLAQAASSVRGIAFVTGYNIASSLMVGFYIRMKKPELPVGLFKTEVQAMEWLKEQRGA
jgi:hypothetical protein